MNKKKLLEVLEPFAQLTALGREDILPDDTILEVHLFNESAGLYDIYFYRQQRPYKPFTLGDLRRARKVFEELQPD